jgi:DNA-binding IclR family transcriptional regulator
MRSLERALDVLEVLELTRAPLRLNEVARRAGLHVATTQRILVVLIRHGYVDQDGTGYTMGVVPLANAHAYLVSNTLANGARPVLQELAHTSGLTSAMSVRIGFFHVLVARVDGANPLRYIPPLGERMPLHVGAGRVYAASLGPDELDELIDRVGEIRLATGQLLTRLEFLERIRVIREQGYAIGYSERVPDASSIGAPVLNRNGELIAVVQLSGLAENLECRDLERYVSEVRQAAAAIAGRLG